MSSVFDSIISLLDVEGITYRIVRHEPTRTSEESAKARDVDIGVGGKAIVMKIDDEFKLFVFSAAKRIDSRKIKAHLAVKKIRFATPEELRQLTGLVPGSVPPFGRPVLPFELFIDSSFKQNTTIAFNAGSLTESIIMSAEAYFKVVHAEMFEFTE